MRELGEFGTRFEYECNDGGYLYISAWTIIQNVRESRTSFGSTRTRR